MPQQGYHTKHLQSMQSCRKTLGYLDHFYQRGPPPRNFSSLNPKLQVENQGKCRHFSPFQRERGTEGYPRQILTLNPKLRVARFNALLDDIRSSSTHFNIFQSNHPFFILSKTIPKVQKDKLLSKLKSFFQHQSSTIKIL